MSEKRSIELNKGLREVNKVRWITVTAIFMAINIAMATVGITVPGGHLYLCDVIICTAAILLDPFAAFVVGGIGSLIGDMLFYPPAMFVSLVTHGIQAIIISAIVHSSKKEDRKSEFRVSLAATLVGAVIMVIGYTLGKIFVYSTYEYAMIKLPYEIAQALLGVVGSLFLCYRFGLKNIFKKMELQ